MFLTPSPDHNRGNLFLFSEAFLPSDISNVKGFTKINYIQMASKSERPIRAIANGFAVLTYDRFERFAVDESGATLVPKFLECHSNRSGPWAACINLMDTHYV
jgi:hypothetical protein